MLWFAAVWYPSQRQVRQARRPHASSSSAAAVPNRSPSEQVAPSSHLVTVRFYSVRVSVLSSLPVGQASVAIV